MMWKEYKDLAMSTWGDVTIWEGKNLRRMYDPQLCAVRLENIQELTFSHGFETCRFDSAGTVMTP